MTHPRGMKALLVGKPWRGGLYAYMHAAMKDVLGADQVTFVATRPTTRADAVAFRKDPAAWSQQVLRTVETTPYDVAIFVDKNPLFSHLHHPQKNILWIFDTGDIEPHLAAAMGHIFISDSGYLEEFRSFVPAAHAAGLLPLAMLPAVHHPAPAAAHRRKHPSMCFVGNKNNKRDTWLNSIYAAGLPCRVYGNYFGSSPLFWQRPLSFRPSVPNAGMANVYARHAISLNIHADVVREGTNMRSFEAAGYQIPQLVEYRPGMEQLFDLEKEMLCFRSVEELAEQYQRLMAEPQRAMAMAAQAQARALAEHTYHHRLRTMLARLA